MNVYKLIIGHCLKSLMFQGFPQCVFLFCFVLVEARFLTSAELPKGKKTPAPHSTRATLGLVVSFISLLILTTIIFVVSNRFKILHGAQAAVFSHSIVYSTATDLPNPKSVWYPREKSPCSFPPCTGKGGFHQSSLLKCIALGKRTVVS